MSTRLQVILDDAEFAEVRRAARVNRMTVAEWVRRAMRAAREAQPSQDAAVKLQAVREAARFQYPTGDIEEMLADIERGRKAGDAQ